MLIYELILCITFSVIIVTDVTGKKKFEAQRNIPVNKYLKLTIQKDGDNSRLEVTAILHLEINN